MSRVSDSSLSRIVFLIVPVFALSVFVYGCSGAQSSGSSDSGDRTIVEENSTMTTTAEETTSETPDAVASGEAGQADGGQDSNASGDAGIALGPEDEATVGLSGDEGVRFVGSCTVNGERERLKGSVPESFDYRTEDGGTVECVIRKRGEGNLKVTMESGGSRSVQQTNSNNGEIRISTSGSGATSSTSTSSSSSSVVSSQSNSSVTITRNNDSSGED